MWLGLSRVVRGGLLHAGVEQRVEQGVERCFRCLVVSRRVGFRYLEVSESDAWQFSARTWELPCHGLDIAGTGLKHAAATQGRAKGTRQIMWHPAAQVRFKMLIQPISPSGSHAGGVK